MFVDPVWQLSCVGSVPLADGTRRRTVNSIGYRWDPYDPGLPPWDYDRWPGPLGGSFAAVLPVMPSSWRIDHIVSTRATGPLTVTKTENLSLVGTVDGDWTAPHIAVHVNLRTNQRGRLGRGFKRFGPVPLAFTKGNSITPDAVVQWQTAANQLLELIPFGDLGQGETFLRPVVWERVVVPHAPVAFATGQVFDVISAGIQPLLTTVRRRRAHARS